MPGHRKHAITAALGGGLITGITVHYSQYIGYFNPGMKDIFFLLVSTTVGGLIVDVEQQFSVAATGLYAGIFISIDTYLIHTYNRHLGHYTGTFLEVSGAVIAITAVSAGITYYIFTEFQRYVPHGKLHQLLLSAAILKVLAISFVLQHNLGPKPEMAEWIVIASVFVYGNLIHVIMDMIL